MPHEEGVDLRLFYRSGLKNIDPLGTEYPMGKDLLQKGGNKCSKWELIPGRLYWVYGGP